MIKVSIVVLDWNQPDLTISTLKSILTSKLQKNILLKIHLIENGSTEDNIKKIQKFTKHTPQIDLTINDKNEGFCKGNNIGIDKAMQANAKYICILNNDVRLNKETLSILIKKLEIDKKLSAVSPKIFFEKNHEYHKNRYSESQKGKVIWALGGKIDWNNIYGSNIGIDLVDSKKIKIPKKPDFLSGCCTLVKASVFKKVGLFDEKYFLYFEDADLSQRIIMNGQKIAIEPKSVLWHINSGSSGANSSLHEYFITRNRLYFASKYARPRTQFALLREAFFTYLFSKSKWKKQAIKDYFFNNMGKGSWI